MGYAMWCGSRDLPILQVDKISSRQSLICNSFFEIELASSALQRPGQAGVWSESYQLLTENWMQMCTQNTEQLCKIRINPFDSSKLTVWSFSIIFRHWLRCPEKRKGWDQDQYFTSALYCFGYSFRINVKELS